MFVYLLIAVFQIVLRRRTPESELRVKMSLFPVLSILTAVAILAVLVQSAFLRLPGRWLGLVQSAVVIGLFARTSGT